jgi:hypothetical protein
LPTGLLAEFPVDVARFENVPVTSRRAPLRSPIIGANLLQPFRTSWDFGGGLPAMALASKTPGAAPVALAGPAGPSLSGATIQSVSLGGLTRPCGPVRPGGSIQIL